MKYLNHTIICAAYASAAVSATPVWAAYATKNIGIEAEAKFVLIPENAVKDNPAHQKIILQRNISAPYLARHEPRPFFRQFSFPIPNASIVLASSEAEAGRMQFQTSERDDEQGAFFVKGVIGLIFLALVHAILKRF